MTTIHCSVQFDETRPACGRPATRYVLLAHPASASVCDDDALHGEFVCADHYTEARVFARPPFTRFLVDLACQP